MKCNFIIILFFILFPNTTYAQKENNTWIISSDIGMDFNTVPPTIIQNTGLKVNAASISSVSDENGNLLFYSEGERVLDKTHNVMENGDDIFGYFHSNHAALIIAQKHSLGLYYLFTNADGPDDESNLYMHIIDMNLNDGMGEVIEKNILVANNVTETMTSTQGPCGSVVLIYSTSDRNIIVQKIDQDGLGEKKTFFNNLNNSNSSYHYGTMTFSNDSKYLIHANALKNFDIYAFNDLNQELSFIKRIEIKDAFAISSFSFSPNDSFLYFSKYLDGTKITGIFQFDFKQLLENEIVPEAFKIVQKNQAIPQSYTLELGPDGKIYCSQKFSEYISVIRNPNEPGAGSDYLDLAIYIGNKGFHSVDFQNKVFRIGSQQKIYLFGQKEIVNCTPLWLTVLPEHDSILWNTGEVSDSILLKESGIYSAEVFINGCSHSDTVIFDLEIITDILPETLSFCGEQNVCLTTNHEWDTYIWNNGSTSSEFCVAEAGIYDVVVSKGNCSYTDTIEIIIDRVSVGITEDTIMMCHGNEICIQADFADSYLWSNNSTNDNICVNKEGVYFLTITKNECAIFDSVVVLETEPPPIINIEDTTLCKGDLISISLPYQDVEWSTGEKGNNLIISHPGDYGFRALYQGCEIQEAFIVTAEADCPEECSLYVPNIFSPNDDGINDYLEIFPNCDLDFYHITIFDRSGSLIFSSNKLEDHWDGNQYSNGVYITLITFSTIEEDELKTYASTITLQK